MHVFMQIKKSYTFISLGREGPFGKEGTLWLLASRFVMNFELESQSLSTNIIFTSNIDPSQGVKEWNQSSLLSLLRTENETHYQSLQSTLEQI